MKGNATVIESDDIGLEFQKAFKKQKRQNAKKRKEIKKEEEKEMKETTNENFDKLIEEEKMRREKYKKETEKTIEEYSKLTSPTYGKGEMITKEPINLSSEETKITGNIKIPTTFKWNINLKCKTLTSLSMHKGGDIVACSGNDGIVRICNTNKKEIIENLIGHQSIVPRVSFLGDNLVSVSLDGTVKVWDIIKGEIITGWTAVEKLTDEKPGYKCLFCNDHGIFAGNSNKKIYQYDIREKNSICEYIVDSVPYDIAQCTNGLMCTAEDNIIRYYDYSSGSPTKSIQDPEISSMFCLNDYQGKYVIAQCIDNGIHCFRGSPFKKNGRIFRGHYSGAWSCRPSFSPDGQYISSGDANGKIFIWSWNKGRVLTKLEINDDKYCITDVIWDRKNLGGLISCGWDGNLRYWN